MLLDIWVEGGDELLVGRGLVGKWDSRPRNVLFRWKEGKIDFRRAMLPFDGSLDYKLRARFQDLDTAGIYNYRVLVMKTLPRRLTGNEKLTLYPAPCMSMNKQTIPSLSRLVMCHSCQRD